MQLSKQNITEKTAQIYDVLIVGGGAGGLSAGIYAQRYRLSSLNQIVVAAGDGALAATAIWKELRNHKGATPWYENLTR